MNPWTRVLIIALLVLVGVGGWFGAGLVSVDNAIEKSVVPATVVRTVSVGETQYVHGKALPAQVRTVVVRKHDHVRLVPRVRTRTQVQARTLTAAVTRPDAVSTVTDVPQQTVVKKDTDTVTVTTVQTEPAETVTRTVTTPPGHADPPGHETRTVTVTVTETVPTGTVTVTVPKGHSGDQGK
jgi:hypothetical protein